MANSGSADNISSRERLLAAAKRLMAEEGYERVSTAAIARAAGTSESQLVRYFTSKPGLLEAIFDESWLLLNPKMAKIIAGSGTARDAVLKILSAMIRMFDRDPALAKLFFFEGRRVRGNAAGIQLSRGFQEFVALVVPLIDRGRKDGSFSKTLKPAVVTSALLGAAEGMIRDRLLTSPAAFRESDIRSVFEAVVSGLGPRPQRRRTR
jgi:AcrR family transcriptional regulator